MSISQSLNQEEVSRQNYHISNIKENKELINNDSKSYIELNERKDRNYSDNKINNRYTGLLNSYDKSVVDSPKSNFYDRFEENKRNNSTNIGSNLKLNICKKIF